MIRITVTAVRMPDAGLGLNAAAVAVMAAGVKNNHGA